MLQQGKLVTVACIASELVDSTTTGHRQQPGTRLSWNTFDRPALKCDQQGILDDLLSDLEIAQETQEGPH